MEPKIYVFSLKLCTAKLCEIAYDVCYKCSIRNKFFIKKGILIPQALIGGSQFIGTYVIKCCIAIYHAQQECF